MKSINFWDMTPCSLLSCKRRLGETYRLHLTCWFLLNYFFELEDGGDVPPKRLLQLNRLHGVISQKKMLFKLQYVYCASFNPREIYAFLCCVRPLRKIIESCECLYFVRIGKLYKPAHLYALFIFQEKSLKPVEFVAFYL
jgi:hypothetical protein